jgi:hypothetical protein
MKKFECKKTELPAEEGNVLSYSDLALLSINAPVKEGFTVEDIRGRIKVLDKLTDANAEDVVELEDAESNVLKMAVAAMKWNLIHKDIISFCDYVKEM